MCRHVPITRAASVFFESFSGLIMPFAHTISPFLLCKVTCWINWILNLGSDFKRIQTKTMDLMTIEQESKEAAQSPSMKSISMPSVWDSDIEKQISPNWLEREGKRIQCTYNSAFLIKKSTN